MIFTKHRFEIWNQSQHPYKHTLSDFSYVNPSAPGVTSVEGAFNWLFAVLYPQTKPAVANVAALPALGNTLNDFRVVLDDGDGKAAAYRWEQREGEVSASWHKIYDMDWGMDGILSHFVNNTQDLYVFKKGFDDLDENGDPLTGIDAGQTIFGGFSANSHLTLVANSGDGVGAQTGYIQLYGNTRPYTNNLFDLGTNSEKFKDLYLSNTALVGTLLLGAGSITDSSGAISFDNENLTTTGTLSSGTHTIGNLVLASASITNTSGAISFDNENLTTTGTLASGVHTIGTLILGAASITDTTGTISFDNENLTTTGNITGAVGAFSQLNVDNLRLDVNTLSTTNTDGNLILLPDGAGIVDIQKALQTVGITATGTVGITGQLNIDNLRLDGNTLSSTDTNGNIILAPNGTGDIVFNSIATPASSLDLGRSSNLFKDFYFSGSLRNASTAISLTTLLTLRHVRFRDAAETSPVQNGDALFYDSVSGTWLASAPDSEIDHGTLAGLMDDDHTQYLLLAGRTGGQSVIGGTDAGSNLIFESTSHATKGAVLTKDNFLPFTNASYSGSWSGIDLGSSLKYFRDIYIKGEAKGLRFENFVSSGLPSSSAANVGRMIYETDTKKIKVDDGTVFRVAGVSKYSSDVAFDGIVTTKDVNVSASITDARTAIIQLLDNANDFERIFCIIKATSASNVRIETNLPLPAGSYRLIVIE